jgi:hypothetical protein
LKWPSTWKSLALTMECSASATIWAGGLLHSVPPLVACGRATTGATRRADVTDARRLSVCVVTN